MAHTAFERVFEVRWADLDPNRHLRNTAYSDYATHTRFSVLIEHGFTPSRFEELAFGPVVFREETRFMREVAMGDKVSIDVTIAGLSNDASRWRIQHHVLRADGATAAVVTLEGSWLDLKTRKLTFPPAELHELFLRMPKTKDFEELDSAVKRP